MDTDPAATMRAVSRRSRLDLDSRDREVAADADTWCRVMKSMTTSPLNTNPEAEV
jgi:hypothetical protein